MSARRWTMAAIAVLALAMIAAPAAMAEGEEFHSEAEHTIIDGEALSEQVIETTQGTIACSQVNVEGTVEEETATQITAVIIPDGCVEQGAGRVLHVYPNSCDFRLTAGIDKGGEHARSHLICSEAGDAIEVHITTIVGELNCLKYPEQTPTGAGLGYTSKEGHITLDATVEGIEYTEVGVCGEGTTANDGTYSGEITLSGTDTEENPVGIWWE